MSTMVMVRQKHKLWYLYVLVGIWSLMLSLFISITVDASGIGGYISEKLIARDGTSNSYLVIGRTGVANPSLDVGMAPVIQVAVATGAFMDGTGTHATLNGNVSSLNGFASASVWFEWGYDLGFGHSTPVQTVNAVGAYSATLSGYDGSKTVYYRLVSQTDGIMYSSPTNFSIVGSSPIVTSSSMISNLVPIAWIAFMLISLLIVMELKLPLVVILLIMTIEIYIGTAVTRSLQQIIQRLWG